MVRCQMIAGVFNFYINRAGMKGKERIDEIIPIRK